MQFFLRKNSDKQFFLINKYITGAITRQTDKREACLHAGHH